MFSCIISVAKQLGPTTQLKFVLQKCFYKTPTALRARKPKSQNKQVQYFADSKQTRAVAGSGGDGCISFLQLWCNEQAGPDGGDGGNGGHVIFEASTEVTDFSHITTILKADDGEKGHNKDCHGRSANHTFIKVPLGTIVKSMNGKIVGDLSKEKVMFVAARGGMGGRGNHFFITDINQSPKICEYGAKGEDINYILELKSIAHIGFIGLPNAGKSTLLQAISRARPRVAPYPFTTIRPHIGMVQYDDYEQIAVADLPGLIPDSHKNKGLGIQFLKHAERCSILMFVIDISNDEPWKHYESLLYEIEQFSPSLLNRQKVIVANKIDLPEAQENIEKLKKEVDVPVIPISAKLGTNVSKLLHEIRVLYDKQEQLNVEKII